MSSYKIWLMTMSDDEFWPYSFDSIQNPSFTKAQRKDLALECKERVEGTEGPTVHYR